MPSKNLINTFTRSIEASCSYAPCRRRFTTSLLASFPDSQPTGATFRKIDTTTFSAKAVPREIHERPEKNRPFVSPRTKIYVSARNGTTGSTSGDAGAKDKRDNASEVRKGEDDQVRRFQQRRLAEMEHFDGPSKPRLIYERPKEPRMLPKFKTRLPLYIAMATLGLGAWGLFLLHATNSERLASSPLRQITYQLRNDERVKEVLGDKVRYAKNWWGFGEPWISGTVNLMQGKVDLKFRVTGSKGSGTVYFTSIRPAGETDFRIVRYKVVADGGKVVQLRPE